MTGLASRYVLHPDGRIIINCAAQMEEDVYNLLAAMQERSPLTSEDIQTLSDDFSQGRSGSRLVTLDGTRYYMTYQSAHILDWTIVGLVPAAVVNAGMNALQSSTIVMVSMIVLGISALALALVHRKSSVKLRRKDMEILYRDEHVHEALHERGRCVPDAGRPNESGGLCQPERGKAAGDHGGTDPRRTFMFWESCIPRSPQSRR